MSRQVVATGELYRSSVSDHEWIIPQKYSTKFSCYPKPNGLTTTNSTVLRFEHGPDPEVLKKSVIASIEANPILGTRYIDGARPHWTSPDPSDFGRAFNLATTEAEFEE